MSYTVKENTTKNQILFLQSFIKVWEFMQQATDNDEPMDDLTNMYAAALKTMGLPKVSADDLLVDLQEKDHEESLHFIGKNPEGKYIILRYDRKRDRVMKAAPCNFHVWQNCRDCITVKGWRTAVDDKELVKEWRLGCDGAMHLYIRDWTAYYKDADIVNRQGDVADEVQTADEGEDKVAQVLLSDGYSFWILLHESGQFSTIAGQASEYGTFDACVALLEKEFGTVN